MDDPFAVGRLERRRDARGAAQRLAQRHRPSEEALLQRLPFDQLENQEWSALFLDDVEERADVGMVDLRDEPRFPLEAREAVGIVGERRRSTLTATSRPRRVSRARYTSPMAP